MTEHFPNLKVDIDIQTHEAQIFPSKINQGLSQDTLQLNCKMSKTKTEFCSSKIKAVYNTQGNPNKSISRLPSQNLAGWKGVGYVQSTQGKSTHTFHTKYMKYYTQKSCHSDKKERQRHSQIN